MLSWRLLCSTLTYSFSILSFSIRTTYDSKKRFKWCCYDHYNYYIQVILGSFVDFEWFITVITFIGVKWILCYPQSDVAVHHVNIFHLGGRGGKKARRPKNSTDPIQFNPKNKTLDSFFLNTTDEGRVPVKFRYRYRLEKQKLTDTRPDMQGILCKY